MKFFQTLENLSLSESWLTIGSFDGVHLGHQAIIRDLVAGARRAEVPAVVLTFDPHPAEILRPDLSRQYLTSTEEKAALLEQLGVDIVIAYPFNQVVASLSAREFLTRFDTHLNISQLLVGYDFAMGRDRRGDIAELRQLGEVYHYDLQVISPVKLGEHTVSSSHVRKLLAEGEVDQAHQMLGRPHRVNAPVTPGAGRGSRIGIPTANLAVQRKKAVPAQGVYVCQAGINGKYWGAVTNIGVRPTFEVDGAPRTIETHILDFSNEIYGQTISLDFLERLRGERKFSGIEALVAQIQADITLARRVLNP